MNGDDTGQRVRHNAEKSTNASLSYSSIAGSSKQTFDFHASPRTYGNTCGVNGTREAQWWRRARPSFSCSRTSPHSGKFLRRSSPLGTPIRTLCLLGLILSVLRKAASHRLIRCLETQLKHKRPLLTHYLLKSLSVVSGPARTDRHNDKMYSWDSILCAHNIVIPTSIHH